MSYYVLVNPRAKRKGKGKESVVLRTSESTRMIAVTALDVCGTLLRNLTLALSKARLNAAIRSTTLSFPSYILLVVQNMHAQVYLVLRKQRLWAASYSEVRYFLCTLAKSS